MKTLANVFNPRRRDPPPSVLVPVKHPNSHSSSSDGSAPTPDDDHDVSHRPTNRFSSWIKFRPTTTTAPRKSPSRPSLPKTWPSPISSRTHSQRDSDTEDDSSSGDDEDNDDDGGGGYYNELAVLTPPAPRPHRASPSHGSPQRRHPASMMPHIHSHINMRTITLSSMNQRPPCPPPFVNAPSGPVFPRSMNPAHSLPLVQTTRITQHKTSLVRRLESRSLSPSESESIAAFGKRPRHASSATLPPRKPNRGLEDEDVLSDLLKKNEKRVGDVSYGVRRWIKRPFFEQRCVSWVWHPQQQEVVCRPIQGSDKAVAALEYSNGLEAIGGIGLVSDTPPEISCRDPLPSLRIAPLLPPDLVSSTSSSTTPNLSPGPLTPTTPTTANRKMLRFSNGRPPEDQDEDDVPLGYHVINRREQEERERKEREEGRKKKMYAAEVTAARSRREAARSGALEKGQTTHTHRSSYLRPAYDPSVRRQASEPDTRQAQAQARHIQPTTPPSPQRFLTEPNKKPRPLSSRSMPEDIQDVKNRRRASAVSESGSVSGKSSHRHSYNNLPTTPTRLHSMPPLPPMPPMPMTPVVPFMPMHVQVPVYAPPAYFVPSPSTPTGNSSTFRPPPSSLRPSIPVTKSADRLPTASSKSESGRPSASRRITVQVTPLSASTKKESRLSTTDNRMQSSYRTSVQVSSSSSSSTPQSAARLYSSSAQLHTQRVAR